MHVCKVRKDIFLFEKYEIRSTKDIRKWAANFKAMVMKDCVFKKIKFILLKET